MRRSGSGRLCGHSGPRGRGQGGGMWGQPLLQVEQRKSTDGRGDSGRRVHAGFWRRRNTPESHRAAGPHPSPEREPGHRDTTIRFQARPSVAGGQRRPRTRRRTDRSLSPDVPWACGRPGPGPLWAAPSLQPPQVSALVGGQHPPRPLRRGQLPLVGVGREQHAPRAAAEGGGGKAAGPVVARAT